MIFIEGEKINDEILIKYIPESLDYKIRNKLLLSQNKYFYKSIDQLNFEILIRKNTVKAARDLSRSYLDFAVFKKSKCNNKYWIRTDIGGFKLRNDVKPYDAVTDIYSNSAKYATECSTAIVIVFLKALADTLPRELFNDLFSNLYLYGWRYLDRDLGIQTYNNPQDYLPGDCRYFKNPDVDPKEMEWQGENAIQLDEDLFYGHDLGIRTSESIKRSLDKHRKSNSNIPSYLMDSVNRLGYKYLSNKYEEYLL